MVAQLDFQRSTAYHSFDTMVPLRAPSGALPSYAEMAKRRVGGGMGSGTTTTTPTQRGHNNNNNLDKDRGQHERAQAQAQASACGGSALKSGSHVHEKAQAQAQASACGGSALKSGSHVHDYGQKILAGEDVGYERIEDVIAGSYPDGEGLRARDNIPQRRVQPRARRSG